MCHFMYNKYYQFGSIYYIWILIQKHMSTKLLFQVFTLAGLLPDPDFISIYSVSEDLSDSTQYMLQRMCC